MASNIGVTNTEGILMKTLAGTTVLGGWGGHVHNPPKRRLTAWGFGTHTHTHTQTRRTRQTGTYCLFAEC